MVARTQITLPAELHKRAREKAAQLGISLAEYLRRLVERDLDHVRRVADPSLVFALGASGGSDVAERKDDYVDEAVEFETGRSRREPPTS